MSSSIPEYGITLGTWCQAKPGDLTLVVNTLHYACCVKKYESKYEPRPGAVCKLVFAN